MWSVPATRLQQATVRKMLSHGWHVGPAAARMVVEVLYKSRWITRNISCRWSGGQRGARSEERGGDEEEGGGEDGERKEVG